MMLRYQALSAAVASFWYIGRVRAAAPTSPDVPQYDAIANYQPTTSIYDIAALAYDLQSMEKLMAGRSPTAFSQARAVYEQGAFSMSYADMVAYYEFNADVNRNASIHGVASDGSPVTGYILAPVKAGSKAFNFSYQIGNTQATYVNCQVGGNPQPNLKGCLNASGTVTIDGLDQKVIYEYNPLTDNKNLRTIQRLSTYAMVKFTPGHQGTNGPLFKDFQKFVDYYGRTDYADEWIEAAFQIRGTTYPSVGNADFTKYTVEGRAKAITMASAYMSIGMYVIRELEDAVYQCSQSCQQDSCIDLAMSALDSAVAYYTGALEGTDGSGQGNLLYNLADEMCPLFKTCGEEGKDVSGRAKVNYDIFHEFNFLKEALKGEDCPTARKHKERIAQLIFIPLVQGTLLNAWKYEHNGEQDMLSAAQASVLAASVLPVLARCKQDDARVVHDNCAVGINGKADFSEVKSAFERNYLCMGITCRDVGGYFDKNEDKFFFEATPCNYNPDDYKKLDNTAKISLYALAGVLVVGLLYLYVRRRRRVSQRRNRNRNDEDYEI